MYVEHESSSVGFDKDARQVENTVTHEQKQVEKVVTHAHRVGGVCGGISLMWKNVDLTWQRNSILFNTTCALNHIALVTVDVSVKPGF